jgi:redox-sensitive bicupin YhaK (pirin superfamily)
VKVGEVQVETRRMGILSNSAIADSLKITATKEARFIVVAGKPLNEPIVQYGPFVMNTQEEIHKTLDDFRSGRLA